ncbi:MAG: ribosome-associated translation inhibitor RaiA [Ardenticatenales bacterium]|nr:ribosome-associated translation inhibitor RaiA [Ardenticatenales bacterium]
MKLIVHGRNVEITDFMRDYVEKKIGRLDRYLPTLTEARVEISEQATRSNNQRHVVQVTLYDQHGTILRGEERDAEIFPAVDTVVDKMHRQIVRYKGKRKDRYQRYQVDGNWGETPPIDLEEEEEDDEGTEVVRTKRFVMSPMNMEEAIEQMQLLGHTFFVYYDADNGNVNVVYRRQDGNYGLIIPELA